MDADVIVDFALSLIHIFFFMDIQALTQYFLQYGAVFIFVIVLLEYLNLP